MHGVRKRIILGRIHVAPSLIVLTMCPIPLHADTYNYAGLATLLIGYVGELGGSELQAVAAAAPAFSWPVYASMPLLHAVCREAVHRCVGGLGRLVE